MQMEEGEWETLDSYLNTSICTSSVEVSVGVILGETCDLSSTVAIRNILDTLPTFHQPKGHFTFLSNCYYL